MQRATFKNGSIPLDELNIKNMKKKTIKSKEEKGLGDITKDVIKKVLPKTAEKLKDCEGCEKRRKALNRAGRYLKNNFNATFG